MTTRKQLITTKYLELTKELKQYINDEVLPSLEDYDICDLLFFINLYLKEINGNYKQSINDLLECKNIKLDDETFETIYNIIAPFIVWYKQLC